MSKPTKNEHGYGKMLWVALSEAPSAEAACNLLAEALAAHRIRTLENERERMADVLASAIGNVEHGFESLDELRAIEARCRRGEK